MGKRCLSRSVSVENLELYSQPNGCCKASPASSFSPELAAIFQLSDISRELSFGSPFSFAGKEKGDSGCTGRAPQWPGRYCRLFSLGINSGYILDTTSRTVSARTAMLDDKRRVFPGSRVGARDDWATASECGMTGHPRDIPSGEIGEGIKKEPEGCLLLTSFRLIF